MARYDYRSFPYRTPPELAGEPARRRPVAIVGAGPVGLALSIDLALAGVPSVVLDDNDRVSVGSRAICWSKRTLEIFDRLGVGRRMVEKGVTWKVGRLFHGDREVYSFDLLPEPGHRMPAFVNLQQYYVEQYLVERAGDFPELIELRWKNRVADITACPDGVSLVVETPDGGYVLDAHWVVACDGARSTVRRALGLDFAGHAFEERFLIADVEMKADFPAERRFWFEPTFHAGQSALLHKQPDDIWRIDLQLGPDADPEAEKRPDKVVPRIRAVVGDRPFEIDWVSVYSFQCRRLERFVHGRVVFAGDAAHVVSPFGARGGNGGIQDVDNLGWKLARVVRGAADASLLDTYDEERIRAADENILHSDRATTFMTPHGAAARAYRTAVLDLAADLPFARRLVNSGRLSLPCVLDGCALQTPADDAAPRPGVADPGTARPGAVCPDAPVTDADRGAGFLLDHLGGGFVLLAVGDVPLPPLPADLAVVRVAPVGAPPAPASTAAPPSTAAERCLVDVEGLVAARLGGGLAWLVRPDQHLAARFAPPTAATVAAALARAGGPRAGVAAAEGAAA